MQEGLHGQKENREEKTCLPQQLYALGGGIDAAGATECWEAHMQRHGDGAAQQVVFLKSHLCGQLGQRSKHYHAISHTAKSLVWSGAILALVMRGKVTSSLGLMWKISYGHGKAWEIPAAKIPLPSKGEMPFKGYFL